MAVFHDSPWFWVLRILILLCVCLPPCLLRPDFSHITSSVSISMTRNSSFLNYVLVILRLVFSFSKFFLLFFFFTSLHFQFREVDKIHKASDSHTHIFNPCQCSKVKHGLPNLLSASYFSFYILS